MNWQSEHPGWCNSTTKQTFLGIDEACLHVNFKSDDFMAPLEVWGQSEKCQECPMWKLGSIVVGNAGALVVNTTYPTTFLMQQARHPICNFTYHFGEFGMYNLNVSSQHCSKISISENPANIYLPFLWAFLFMFVIVVMWVLKCVLRERSMPCWCSSWFCPRVEEQSENEAAMLIPSESPNTTPQQGDPITRHRIRCLDSFRGFTIMSMILVNYGGGGYWFLQHSPWNGVTVADVIFPCFVWIMGASCVLSLNAQLRRALRRRRILFNIVRRSTLMFLIGLLLNSLNNNNIETLRIPGVFQRLSFVYLIVALMELLAFDPEDNERYAWFASVRDLVCSWRQWIIVIALITTHLLITFLLPVPGCPLGYVGAGGLEKGSRFHNCTGGAARLVDVTLLGEKHIYQRPTTRAVYNTDVAFDPEGLLGALTSVLCAFLGAEAAKVLLIFPSNNQRIFRWLTWSIITGVLGGVLCSFSINDGFIPINKNLWSLSYVLITSSIAFTVLTVLYIFIDVLAWWSGAPFRYAGMNALLLYIGHVFAKPLLPFSWTPLASTHAAHLTMNATASAIWIFISWLLYRKRLFLTL